MNPLFAFTKKTWDVLHTGANGRICYGLEVTNPEFDPKSGHQQFWHINDFVFRSSHDEIMFKFQIKEDEYQDLLTALNALPTHAVKKST